MLSISSDQLSGTFLLLLCVHCFDSCWYLTSRRYKHWSRVNCVPCLWTSLSVSLSAYSFAWVVLSPAPFFGPDLDVSLFLSQEMQQQKRVICRMPDEAQDRITEPFVGTVHTKDCLCVCCMFLCVSIEKSTPKDIPLCLMSDASFLAFCSFSLRLPLITMSRFIISAFSSHLLPLPSFLRSNHNTTAKRWE